MVVHINIIKQHKWSVEREINRFLMSFENWLYTNELKHNLEG